MRVLLLLSRSRGKLAVAPALIDGCEEGSDLANRHRHAIAQRASDHRERALREPVEGELGETEPHEITLDEAL